MIRARMCSTHQGECAHKMVKREPVVQVWGWGSGCGHSASGFGFRVQVQGAEFSCSLTSWSSVKLPESYGIKFRIQGVFSDKSKVQGVGLLLHARKMVQRLGS